MIQQIPHVDHFKQQLRAALRQEAQQCRAVQFAKHSNIYTCGEQDETVYFIEANLVTVDSEQRLGKTLLHLARKLGQQDPRSIRIEPRITHEELAAMVGTTRSRIGTFMHHFLELGLIEFSTERFLIVKEHKLMAYLARVD